jgi:hypothetical protein
MVRGDPARDVCRLATQAFGNDDVFVVAMVRTTSSRRTTSGAARISHPSCTCRGAARRGLIDILSYRFDPARTGSTSRVHRRRDPADPAARRPARARSPIRSTRSWSCPRRLGRGDQRLVREISDREFVDRGLDANPRAIAEEGPPTARSTSPGRPHVKSPAEIMARDCCA